MTPLDNLLYRNVELIDENIFDDLIVETNLFTN